MGFDFGANAKDRVMGAQASVPKTNLSEHVDGGESSISTVPASTQDEDMTLYGGVAVVLTSVALLWFMGAIAFRGLPSL